MGGPLVHHLMLGVALVALGAGALRVAALAAPWGLDRVLAAAPLAAAAAAVEALGLGLVGWGSSAIALTLAALVTWGGAHALVPAPVRGVASELHAWWRGLSPPAQAGIGALAGAALAATVWFLRHPEIGTDGLLYHLPQIVAWVHDGHPGSQHHVYRDLPVQSYPLTGELLLGWLLFVSRGLAPIAPWAMAMAVLFAVSGWSALRRMGASPPAVVAAIAAVASTELFLGQLNGPYTDLPALAWLACTAALCAAAPARPGLLAPAIVAASLAGGTKTTVIPLAVAALAIAGWRCRAQLRVLAWPLAAAAVLGTAAGGVWHLRNLWQHGSPFWPFQDAPWGDPPTAFVRRYGRTLLEAPKATLDGRLGLYRDHLAGGLVLLGGALVVGVADRRGRVRALALAAALSVLLWSVAPFTGETSLHISISTTRYLLPAMSVAAGCLALAASASQPLVRGVAWGALVAALVANAVRYPALGDFVKGTPNVPPVGWLLAGAAAGAIFAWLARRVTPMRRPLASPVAAGLVIAATVALAPAASGYMSRHAGVGYPDAAVVRWLAALPGYSSQERPVAIWPVSNGALAGDRLTHEVILLGRHEACRALRARARRGYVLTLRSPGSRRLDACLARRPDYDDGTARIYEPAS